MNGWFGCWSWCCFDWIDEYYHDDDMNEDNLENGYVDEGDGYYEEAEEAESDYGEEPNNGLSNKFFGLFRR